jgi:hypothetical protein
MNIRHCVLPIVILCATFATAQTKSNNRLMSDADYKAFLLQVEAALPKWETALKNIDPEKDPQISYSQGKLIVNERNLGLTEVGNIRVFVAKQRVKRTVYGELGLKGFLQSLYDVMDSIVNIEEAAGLTLSSLEKYSPELSVLLIRIGNDVLARVELLENGACP